MSPNVLLIAAMEREIAPLAKVFRRSDATTGHYPVLEKGSVRLLYAGIGGEPAARAASWAIDSLRPEVVMSIGFAGALTPDYKVGDVITPAEVVDGSSGETFSAGFGNGVLVTNTGVLAEGDKRQLAARYGAIAVDMEAAAVARVAQENRIPFFAVKAVSDEVDFRMPPLEKFVGKAGKFQTSRLLAHVAVRPAFWPVLMHLGANAKRASSQLCRWLENQMSRDFQDMLGGVRGPVEIGPRKGSFR